MPESKNPDAEGGYIFISHAHKDIIEIRKIRNILEDNGLEPICFYLRCLSDRDEIIDLIKREIDAREWFLLVDSENARKSNWVKTEVEYIKSKNKEKIISLTLEDKDSILPILDRLSNSMRVFISYAHKDYNIAKLIADACRKKDLKVFFDLDSIRPGQPFVDQIIAGIEDAAEKGCVVIIVSSASVESHYVKKEVEYALRNRAFILPVIVDDVELPEAFCFSDIQCYKLTTPVTDIQIEKLADNIEDMLSKRLHGNA